MIVTRMVVPYCKKLTVVVNILEQKNIVGRDPRRAVFKNGGWYEKWRLVYQDTSVGQLTKDDDRGGIWRVAAFGA